MVSSLKTGRGWRGELERPCGEVYVVPEETIEKQRQRIAWNKKRGRTIYPKTQRPSDPDPDPDPDETR